MAGNYRKLSEMIGNDNNLYKNSQNQRDKMIEMEFCFPMVQVVSILIPISKFLAQFFSV